LALTFLGLTKTLQLCGFCCPFSNANFVEDIYTYGSYAYLVHAQQDHVFKFGVTQSDQK